MSFRKSFSRGFATLSVLAAGAVVALPASAQTYEWIGNGAGGTNQLWENAAPFWSTDPVPGTTPATNPPGSALGGAASDVANIRNTRPLTGAGVQQTEQVRLQTDAGSVATVQVGGYFGLAPTQTTGNTNWLTQLNIRTNGAANIGQLILGRANEINSDTDPTTRSRGGQFIMDTSSLGTVTIGSVVSDGGDGGNEFRIDENATSGGAILNGDIDGGGAREIGLDIRFTTQSRLQLGGALTLNVDDVKVAAVGNANTTAVLDFGSTGGGSVMNANSLQVGQQTGTNNVNALTSDGTLTISNGSAINVVGGNGTNGNADIGNANRTTNNMTTVGQQTAIGVVNVEVGTFSATNLVALGAMTRNSFTVANGASATGTLNLNNAASVVNLGRVQLNGAADQETLSGGLDVGQERTGNGTVNVGAGLLNSIGRVYVGGTGTNGQDSGTVGNLNVSGDSAVQVGVSDTSVGGRIPTMAGGGTTQLGSADLQIGRDGTGTMTQTGGTTNIYRGNLVLGTNSATTVASASRDYNNDGTNVTITVRGFNADPLLGGTSLAAFDPRNLLNQNVFDDTSLASPDWEPDPVNVGDYKLTASGQAKLVANAARGTLNLSGGTINVGSTQGAEFRLDADGGTPGAQPGDIAELFNDVSFDNGGGDMTISGTGVMNVERNFNMGANADGKPINTLTLSDSAVLNIGFGTAGNLAGQASDIAIIGGGTDVNISGNLALNGGVNGTNLTFDFQGSSAITDFNFDVAGNANLNGAELFLDGTGGLASVAGLVDIKLIDQLGNVNGLFSNWAESQPVAGTPYFFRYALAGGGIGLSITAIPEPSSLAILSFGCIGLVARRRRRS